MLKVATVCSGVGSPEVAIRNLGIKHEIVFGCEIDKYARQTYLANFNPSMMLEDMTKEDWEDEKYYSDIFIGGIPCQAFSLAGKRLGELDARGLLFYDFYRYVKNQQPKYFIIENVKGLLSMDKGNVFNNWKALLGQSENGSMFLHTHEDSLMYNLHWKVLNTKNFGLPQNRERVFLIGIRKDLPNDFVFPKEFPLELRLKDLLEEEVDEKYYLSDKLINTFLNRPQAKNYPFKPIENTDEEIACCLNARYYKMGATDNYIKDKNKEIIQISNNNKSNVGTQPYQQDRIYHSNGIYPALSANKSDLNITEHKNYIQLDINGKGQNNGTKTETNATEILRLLFTTVSEETIKEWQSYVDSTLQQDGLLQSRMHEESIFNKSNQNGRNNHSQQSSESTAIETKRMLRDLWKRECNRCSPQRRESIKQLFRQFTKTLSVMPYKSTQSENMHYSELQSETQGTWLLRQALSEIQEVRKSITNDTKGAFRIRKLTVLECFRLQGFPDDFVKPVSSSQLYKQAGNSISVPVVENILKILLKKYIN